ncbi:hypothetical protein QSV08_06985 [Maribacter sp. BPC-D8]|uniref:hypothetical protein n=1 Tax=Maribacter sp. BPC-D8 TaxID=3053613 RepID=UPI002B49E2A7|nr:hypothetical protein [Maribacter sp. BPC-D8]WRI30988.1 hypothetical protein QSV08_06985 [Maribacter sp. BPC-D8]
MIFIIIGLLFFVQQCTSINLLPSFVSNENNYKYLSTGVSSENYVIDSITDKTYLYITYDTINNYFIVDDGYQQIKISTNGSILFKTSDKTAEMPFKTHYVFGDSTVYDFSQNKIEPESYFKRINADTEKLEKKWITIFEEFYNQASTVVYGNNDIIYLKINEGWVALHTSENYYLEGDNSSERTFENYPAKYNQLIFLKDTKSNTYSDWMSHSGSSIDRKYNDYDFEHSNYPENEFNYQNNKIKKIGSKKTESSSTFAYTPIIAQFLAVGYYKLQKGDEYVRFKEDAVKFPFWFFQSDGYLNNYTLPEQFRAETEVSFIRYSYPTNANKSKSEGLYLVKRK